MQSPPRLFLSSTINDFRDLRSSLRFWLEELGYVVVTTETGDVAVESSLSTLANCLDLLRSCDYVILLIGSRRGSYCNEKESLTITRAEYREAYQLACASKIKLVSLLRFEVQQALEAGNMQVLEDFQFTREFVSEIRRDVETRQAVQSGAALPVANWLYTFRDFRDAVAVLTSTLRIGTKLRKLALQANLAWELTANLRRLVSKEDSGIYPIHRDLAVYRDLYPLSLNDALTLQKPSLHDAKKIAVFSLLMPYPEFLTTQALNEAIDSGEFLEYEPRTDGVAIGELQSAMLNLRTEIDRVKGYHKSAPPSHVAREATDYAEGRAEGIKGSSILGLYAISDRLYNVVVLSSAILAFLKGGNDPFQVRFLQSEYPMAKSNPDSPSASCSSAEIENWAKIVNSIGRRQ